jgi:hypothetical protein
VSFLIRVDHWIRLENKAPTTTPSALVLSFLPLRYAHSGNQVETNRLVRLSILRSWCCYFRSIALLLLVVRLGVSTWIRQASSARNTCVGVMPLDSVEVTKVREFEVCGSAPVRVTFEDPWDKISVCMCLDDWGEVIAFENNWKRGSRVCHHRSKSARRVSMKVSVKNASSLLLSSGKSLSSSSNLSRNQAETNRLVRLSLRCQCWWSFLFV